MYRFMNALFVLGAAGLSLGCSPSPMRNATAPVAATLEDYQSAERFLAPNVDPLVTDRILSQY